MRTSEAQRPASGHNSVGQILDGILDRRKPGAWPVSVALTVLAIRKSQPQCDLTDEHLAELVALRAIERGRNVVFDADLICGP